MTRLTVTFHSRAEIKKLVDDEFVDTDAFVISINDNESERKELFDLLIRVGVRFVSMTFPDDEKSFDKLLAEKLFSEIDEAYEAGIQRFIVHCWAGVSRSGAIAKYINDFYGEGENHPILGNYKVYNKRVYTMLESAFQKNKFGLTQSWD